jgi:pimeloyl-ACP methyl ester carboxylesterase
MRLQLDDVTLVVDDHGAGSPVVLLHGWPDTRELWRHQVPALLDGGYRVIAPDLRGFGESSKPAEVQAYSAPRMVGDVVGLLDHLSIERAHLVGHDWGAAIAWMTAALRPDRVASIAALSVGHPAALRAAGWAQRQKSWYMLLFQFRGVAERWLSADGFRNLREWSAHPDIDAVAERLADPEALTASLNLYRAILPPEALVEPPPQLPPVQAPAMGIWSSGDLALTEESMTGSAEHVAGPWRYERLDGVGHWLQLEAPGLVNALLLDFLARHRDRAPQTAPAPSAATGGSPVGDLGGHQVPSATAH